MQIQLIRNATMKINYAGKTLLTDPMLSKKGSMDSFAGIAKNPTIDLPIDSQQVLQGVDAVLVSHVHPDHFDELAVESISKDLPLFCQPIDKNYMTEKAFQSIKPVQESLVWENITITRTGGKHGSDSILEKMGEVSGFVLQADGEPTIYWIGDSILCDEVKKVMDHYQPDIIITHSGGATIPGFNPILMDDKETVQIAELAPRAKVVAVHIEALDHCAVSREKMRESSRNLGEDSKRVIIPQDGEIIEF